MRVAFLGSPPFAKPVLERLLASSHDVCAVVTAPDRPRGRGRTTRESSIAALAREHDVPLLQPERARGPEFLDALRAHEPDALIVASYGEILREDVLELAPLGAFNVHASVLPRWRGASPIQRAILEGDATTGVTIQRMVLALDAGDVLLAKETPIGDDETSGALLERLAVLGGEAAVEALDALAAGTATFEPQDESLVTLAKKLSKADGAIDWTRDAAAIARQVRAFHPWPGTRTTLPNGSHLVVLQARPIPKDELEPDEYGELQGARPGTLLHSRKRLSVATGDGALDLREVKPAGKGAMAGDAFRRGARLEPGVVFGVVAEGS